MLVMPVFRLPRVAVGKAADEDVGLGDVEMGGDAVWLHKGQGRARKVVQKIPLHGDKQRGTEGEPCKLAVAQGLEHE